MVASSLPSRTGSPASGAVRATMSSHAGKAVAGASGVAMHRRPVGTPGFMASQPSSLPTNSSLASLWFRIWLDRLRRQRRIEGHRDTAGHPDREVGHQPPRGVFRQDRDAVARRNAQALQMGGHAPASDPSARAT